MSSGGKEKAQTNRMIQEQSAWGRKGSDAFNAIAQPQQQGAVNAANNIQQAAFDNFNRVGQGAGWIDPNMRTAYLNSIGVGPGSGSNGSGGSSGAAPPKPSQYGGVRGLYNEFSGKGGGVDAAPIRAAMAGMRDIAGSGGWSPEDRAKQEALIGQFEEMGKTGGLSADDMNRMRGGGVFEEFQKTGGYTPEQISDLRARSNSTMPAYYDAVRQGQNRMASIQGGNPAASAAMSARLARDQAKGMREQSLDTELGLNEQIREGRRWGAEGGAEAEGVLQNLRTGNMLKGMGGAADTRGNMLNSIAQNRTAASSGWTQGELGLGGLIQEGRQFGTKGLEGLADREAAAARANAANRSASNAAQTRNLQWLANFEAGNTMDAGGGMTDLYRSTPGEVNMWNQALLGNRGMSMNEQGQAASQHMQNNPYSSALQNISGVAGMAAGAMTGLGALGMGGGAAKAATGGLGANQQGWNNMSRYFSGN
jgi:hypothetical protein